MPNWCYNRIKFSGTPSSISKIKTTFQSVHTGYRFTARRIMAMIMAHSKLDVLNDEDYMYLKSIIENNMDMTQYMSETVDTIWNSFDKSLLAEHVPYFDSVWKDIRNDFSTERTMPFQSFMAWIDSLESTPEKNSALEFDFCHYVPLKVGNMLTGFNGFEQTKSILSEFCGTSVDYDSQYNWQNANWGTKWNAARSTVEETEKNQDGETICMVVEFDTPWSPADFIISNVAERFCEVTIVHDYSEPNMGFCGRMVYESGKLECDLEGEIEYDSEEEVFVAPDFMNEEYGESHA